MSDIDPNVVTANVIAELIKSFFTKLESVSLNFLSDKYSYLFEDFEDYLRKTYLKCNELKIIINQNYHTLDDIYVNTNFQCGDNIFRDEELIQKARDCERLVVTGFGGIGKTIFSKKLWSSIFHEPYGKIPIFFELRQLNNMTDANLLAFVRVSISAFKK